MTEPVPFAIDGPLPSGLSVLEASAGTGKTYALSALAVRFVAEFDTPAAALCIVSFTEAATAELRGRVRARLVEVADALERGIDPGDDLVLAAVARVDHPDELVRRIARLRTAVAEFDAATITTIHGFCGRVLAMAGDGLGDQPIERRTDDVDEVVNDLLIAHASPDHPLHDVVEFVAPDRLAVAVSTRLQLPDAQMQRYDPDEEIPKRMPAEPRRRQRAMAAADLVDQAHDLVIARRARSQRRTLDRVVVDTRDLLVGAESASLVAALRARYRVVLIDEFQDTDRVQWHLFQHAFVGGEDAPAVVLVGDPKQSIYRFRGAELSAYLDARSAAASVRSLSVNRRSDGPLLEGLDRMFRGFTFGSDDVEFQPVEPADANRSSRLDAVALGVDGAASPVEVRMVPASDEKLGASEARRAVMADLVAVAARLLGAAPQIDESDGGRRPLCARDIAVLVRSNVDANRVVAALADAGIAAATAGATSVLDTDAAQQWRLVLRALERPGSQRAARACALGWFIGHSAAEVAAYTDDDLAALHELLGDWSALLARRGVAAFLAAARAHGLGARVLSRRGGERHLTDLEHIAELLHTATGARPASAASLRRLLADAAAFGNVDDADSVVSRRIDRDDDAVQVLTAHRAKGLEYPVVLCPTLWAVPRGKPSVKHASLPDGRLIDASWVAGSDDTRAAAGLLAVAKAEAAGEERRLLYVALTRAKHRCVLWWAPVSSGTGVLGELLQHALDTTAPPSSLADLRPLADSSGGTIGVASVLAGVPSTPRADVDTVEPLPLAAATTDRVLDRAWRVWSFSGVKAVADAVEFDQPVQGGTDEPALADAVPDEPGLEEPVAPHRAPLPLADAPGGTEFGTLVHQVLEQVDFTSTTLLDDLTERCAASLQYRSLHIGAVELAAGLQAAIEAPLGGPVGAMRLADLAPADRLNELDFDLPLGRLTAARIGTVLAQHLPADDLLAPWARAMAGGAYDFALDGVLTGSIDLVARFDGGTRFWVADYKTNQLGRDNPYGRADMAAAMAHHHYPLQAALYLVALHRMLRWRLPSYEPRVHLGGAAYLFVRGMVPAAATKAAATNSDNARGVFWWQPPSAAVEALDRLLAGESSDA